MSNFAQTPVANERTLRSEAVRLSRRVAKSESQSKTAEEKRLLLELARAYGRKRRSLATAPQWSSTTRRQSTGRPCKPPNDVPTLLCKTDTTELNGTEMSQARWPAITLGVMLLCESGPALAEQSPAERRGFRYVRVHCAQCHAIDKVSTSPVTNAPPLRVLNLKLWCCRPATTLSRGSPSNDAAVSAHVWRNRGRHGVSQDAALIFL